MILHKSCSVVMATYNGAKYIIDQLDSIRMQTRIPEEVIICDDRSTDTTVKILNDYINKYSLENWKVIINDNNLGWRKNFINGINLCSSDVIFCADQDDIWKNNKIEIMMHCFEENDKIEVLTSDYDAFYEKQSKHISYHPKLGKKGLTAIVFDEKYNIVKRPGCVMAFKKDIIKYINLLWDNEDPHDKIIWIVGLLNHSLFYVNESLINYRRHESNNSDVVKKKADSIIESIKIDKKLVKRIFNNVDCFKLSTDEKHIIKKHYDFLKKREKAIKNKNLIQLLFLIRYIKFYPKFRTYIFDFVVVCKNN